jgi:hypothetical protein
MTTADNNNNNNNNMNPFNALSPTHSRARPPERKSNKLSEKRVKEIEEQSATNVANELLEAEQKPRTKPKKEQDDSNKRNSQSWFTSFAAAAAAAEEEDGWKDDDDDKHMVPLFRKIIHQYP